MNTWRTNARPAPWAAMAFLAWILMASPAACAELKALGSGDRLAVLPSILALHRGDSPLSGSEIKVFEVGGGDPAMNGSFVYVCISHDSTSLTWKTGLNIRSVDSMSNLAGNMIRIDATEDFMDKSGAIMSRKASYRFRFHLDGGVLQDSLTVEKLER